MSNILHQLSQLDWMHNWSPAKGRSHERLKRNRRAAVRLSSCTTVRSLSDMKVKMRHKSIKTEKWESFSDVFVFVLRIPELPESFTSIRPVSVQLSTFDTVFSSYKIDYLSSFVISIPVSPYGVNKSLKLTDYLEKVKPGNLWRNGLSSAFRVSGTLIGLCPWWPYEMEDCCHEDVTLQTPAPAENLIGDPVSPDPNESIKVSQAFFERFYGG